MKMLTLFPLDELSLDSMNDRVCEKIDLINSYRLDMNPDRPVEAFPFRPDRMTTMVLPSEEHELWSSSQSSSSSSSLLLATVTADC
jgi:hypothetical protein